MWLKSENRCLVLATSFAEYAPEPNPETKKKDVVWFALNEDRLLFAFTGIWTVNRLPNLTGWHVRPNRAMLLAYDRSLQHDLVGAGLIVPVAGLVGS